MPAMRIACLRRALTLAGLGLSSLFWFACESASEGADDLTPRCVLELHADVLEGEALVQPVACSDGARLPPGGTIAVETLPEGAEFDAERSELRWTPSLAQAGTHVIELRQRDAVRLGQLEVDVVDAYADPDNMPIVAAEHYLREYTLPVLHLTVSPDINRDAHEPASVVYLGHTFAGTTAKYRGSTSRHYPKRSYTLKFAKDDPFIDREHGFEGARRIVLTSTFDDNSYLRQRLAYTLWNQLSEQHMQVHTFNAVVYVDGEYRGLYVVSDHIDDDFIDDAGAFGHGNLYKARNHRANFRLDDANGSPKATLHDGYTKEEGTPESPDPAAFEDLDALVQWVATASDDEFASDLDRQLIRAEFEDWLIFVCLIQASDSAGKNSYLYHDPRDDAPEPRWRYVPWDFNASFGQGYRTQRRALTDFPLPAFSAYNELFARMLRDPALSAQLRERFRDALEHAWRVDQVLALFDTWVSEIGPSALRDEQRWGEAYRESWARADLTTYVDEVAYVRAFIEARWSFMAGEL